MLYGSDDNYGSGFPVVRWVDIVGVMPIALTALCRKLTITLVCCAMLFHGLGDVSSSSTCTIRTQAFHPAESRAVNDKNGPTFQALCHPLFFSEGYVRSLLNSLR